MHFVPINREKVDAALEFLAKGFGWPMGRYNQVKEFILEANSSLGFYGFAMYADDDNISSAILLPFQGYIGLDKVISLMSWYTKPSYRGINSFLFAQKLKKFLLTSNFIITNYTPNQAVSSLLKSLDFKIMEGFRKKEFFVIKPFKLLFSWISSSKISLKSNSYKASFENFKVNKFGNTQHLILDTSNKKSSFCCIKNSIKKKIFGFQLSIPIIHILLVEDQNHLLEFWDILVFLIFKKYKTFFVIADFHFLLSVNKKFLFGSNPLNYLIYTENKFLKFVPPLGSELSISNY